MERACKKEESRLDELKFKQQGLEGERKHISDTINDMEKEIEEAQEKQKDFEEEQSYNRATQLKLYQTFDEDAFKMFKSAIEPNPDPAVKEIVSLFVGLLYIKPSATDEQVKEAFTNFQKLTTLMKDPKLEDIPPIDEKKYFQTQDILSKKVSLFGSDKTGQERKNMCNILLHYIVFTLGISMAKRNIQRAAGRLEKMQKDYITKRAELAKKNISAVDPEQIKLCGIALATYKNTINFVQVYMLIKIDARAKGKTYRRDNEPQERVRQSGC